MSERTPVLDLPYIQPSQAQKHVTHNEAIRLLDVAVQLSVADRDQTAPPADPAIGQRHIVSSSATGPWAGQDGQIAIYEETGWAFITPQAGWRAHVIAESQTVFFDLTLGWQDGGDLPQSAIQLGINASADAVNRLAVASENSLFTHDGDSHRVKVNKAAVGDTASVLIQSGYSGRVELGAIGDDDFTLKVSDDGTAWNEALRAEGATGKISIPQDVSVSGTISGTAVMQDAEDTTPGRLMRADYGYSAGNLLGTVSQSAGVPTGAVIESGSNANGDYVRFADGTQICTHTITTSGSAGVVWIFPATFAGSPLSRWGAPASTIAQLVTSRAPSSTQVTFDGWSAGGSRAVFLALVSAIGRWF